MKNKEKFIAESDISIIEALKIIDAGGKGILFLVDCDQRLIGCITDGDVRRWIIKTNDLTVKVASFMVQSPKYIFKGEENKAAEIMSKFPVNALPVLDKDRKIYDIIFKNSKASASDKERCNVLKGVPVVIMAGGKGMRLYPFTKILPKPLIPIGEIPITERIMNRFTDSGVSQFFLTVNYKKQMIKSYFQELEPSYSVVYVEEEQPLGTGGSLRLIEKEIRIPFFVTNCDILIEAKYEDIYQYHISSKNIITVVSSLKRISIPYGVIKVKEGGLITGMEEKPAFSQFINTGMYIINPEIIRLIPENQFFHMTDLIEKALVYGYRVGMYPISEDAFLDMGEFKEMKKMEEKLHV